MFPNDPVSCRFPRGKIDNGTDTEYGAFLALTATLYVAEGASTLGTVAVTRHG